MWNVLQKPAFTEIVFYGFRDVMFIVFWRCWEQIFRFLLPENRLENKWIFDGVTDPKPGRPWWYKALSFRCSQLNSRWLIVESMTDDCGKADGILNPQPLCPWQAGAGGSARESPESLPTACSQYAAFVYPRRLSPDTNTNVACQIRESRCDTLWWQRPDQAFR